jgi:hypothetical protein
MGKLGCRAYLPVVFFTLGRGTLLTPSLVASIFTLYLLVTYIPWAMPILIDSVTKPVSVNFRNDRNQNKKRSSK